MTERVPEDQTTIKKTGGHEDGRRMRTAPPCSSGSVNLDEQGLDLGPVNPDHPQDLLLIILQNHSPAALLGTHVQLLKRKCRINQSDDSKQLLAVVEKVVNSNTEVTVQILVKVPH